MTVGVHLPGAPGALAASVLDIGASDGLAAGNITVTTEAFSSGDQAFVGAGRTDAVDLFVTDAAPALFANANGADLVLIASFQHSSTWRLLTLADGPVASLAALAGGSMYVDGVHGDEAPVLLAMKDAGISIEGLTFVYPEDPAIPFDATLLHDGTVKAALVRSIDGFARTAQYVDPATGATTTTLQKTKFTTMIMMMELKLMTLTHSGPVALPVCKDNNIVLIAGDTVL